MVYIYGYSNSLNDEEMYLNWKDKQNRYTFVTEAIVHYSNAPHIIFRNFYHFNNKSEIELYRRETEELTDSISKIGKITEMPL
ncbi:hypothetical protein HY750_00190 [Candidatus Kuenenbacteria bacterium]|nr:hypothetical protein [Candidatus Kuenenbacteria bacterium]